MESSGEKKARGVALDANMLLAVEQFRVDLKEGLKNIFGGKIEVVVPTQVMEELERLGGKEKKLQRAASVAEKVLKQLNAVEKKVDARNADEALLLLSEKGYIVATNDWELKKKIMKKGGKVLHLRQKKRLEFA
ncbi:MAG: PIN domain-containing protein [Candidatus Diapherotrites archaeon]